MKFLILVFQKTPLHIAIEKSYPQIVQLLLQHYKIDVNIKSIETNKLF